ncbi:hypothetical protein D9758_017467 [Tetrapyrgos nigripes]|uniref:Uncharacterized protein n=1 Tax=Tetrapyrgos nigripes TaxID=182062 RepID=A0A8H5C2G1_9AGAR|nr:hypothetical protein D9758_017467 [Tetrapyrgos nigripes]
MAQEHPTFYFHDEGKMLVFSVENVLFRTPVGLLILHSDMIRGLMSFKQRPITVDTTSATQDTTAGQSQQQRIPYPEKEGDEGSRSNPIVISGLTADGFAGVLSWIWKPPYKNYEDPDNSPSRLIDIIEASRYLMIQSCGRWAINQLKLVKPPLSSISKLALSHCYLIFDADWIGSAVSELVLDGPVKSIGQPESLSELSSTVVHIISAAHVTLLQERINLTQSIVKVDPSEYCDAKTHDEVCHPIWINIWWGTVARRLLHPRNPLPLSEIASVVAAASRGEPGGVEMNVSCKFKYITEVKNGGHLDFQERIIAAAVDSVRKYLVTCHMNIEEFDVPVHLPGST